MEGALLGRHWLCLLEVLALGWTRTNYPLCTLDVLSSLFPLPSLNTHLTSTLMGCVGSVIDDPVQCHREVVLESPGNPWEMRGMFSFIPSFGLLLDTSCGFTVGLLSLF